MAANAKNMEQISGLRGSGGLPLGNFFLIMQNAANWAVFIIFVRPLGGGHGPPCGAAYGTLVRSNISETLRNASGAMFTNLSAKKRFNRIFV